MIYIDPEQANIIEARTIHYNNIKCYLLKKVGSINKNCKIPNCKICANTLRGYKKTISKKKGKKTVKTKVTFYFNKIIEDKIKEKGFIDKLLNSDPASLALLEKKTIDDLKNTMYSQVLSNNNISPSGICLATFRIGKLTSIDDINKELEKLINYETWFKNKEPSYQYSPYHLAKKLDRRTCTYCNRLFTSTITEHGDKKVSKVTRPQFDHWFPKSKHPLLALSFYNLIPSCSVCNSNIKGSIDMDLDIHHHPYYSEFCNDFGFSIKHIPKNMIKVITVGGTQKTKDTAKQLKLEELYSAHIPEVKDLINLRKSYSDIYIKCLATYLNKIKKLSESEIHRIIFNVESKKEDYHKVPLSKFKNDILKELGVIEIK
ncbi:hypothetical protein [Flammeovirga sp. OC4]|uniref:hypothetical protein n=1 Tax=Flammeovirga sp. OC4 TaxID=1382345 RepID=UPI000693E75A|nr:hypothetical protein [Flammeovirga sp. OC4]